MIMLQGPLSFNYELPKKLAALTGHAGVGVFLDLIYESDLLSSIEKHLDVRTDTQGWSDAQCIITILLLNLVGGQCVDDVHLLENDQGLCCLMHDLEKREFLRSSRILNFGRWRKPKMRIFPSPTAIFNFLRHFHDASDQHDRSAGFAYIPQKHAQLTGLQAVLKDLLSFEQKHHPEAVATLDQDATLDKTFKQNAFFCYKGYKAYQPMNTYWFENRLLVHSEFRDGNVNAGFEELRVLQEALNQLPEGVKQVNFRADTAGYQVDLIRYCSEGKNGRFGIIKFSIGCPVTPEFKKAVKELSEKDWQAYYHVDQEGVATVTDHEVAELNFVPNWISYKKSNPDYRYVAIREKLNNCDNKTKKIDLPFQTIHCEGDCYKLFGIITNRFDLSTSGVVQWNRERCGKSEEVHKYQKIDLTCENLPSKYFGSNAAWWQIMVLSFNLINMMKNLLGLDYGETHLKYLRDNFINIPGYVIHHARKLVIRLGMAHTQTIHYLILLRKTILTLGIPPVIHGLIF